VKKPQQLQNDKEEKLRLASGVFLAMFFGSLIAALLNILDGEQGLGIILLICSFLFLAITVSAYFKPLVSTIIGLVIYVLLVGWLFYSFPDVLFNRTIILFVIGFLLILGAVKDSMKKKDIV